MKTTIDIPESLYKKVKIRAIERGVSLKQIVLTSLEREMAATLSDSPPSLGSRWATRSLRPKYKEMIKNGALKPKPGTRSIDDIITEIKTDQPL